MCDFTKNLDTSLKITLDFRTPYGRKEARRMRGTAAERWSERITSQRLSNHFGRVDGVREALDCEFSVRALDQATDQKNRGGIEGRQRGQVGGWW